MDKTSIMFLKKIIPFAALFFFVWLGFKRTDFFSTHFIARFKNNDKTYEISNISDLNAIKRVLSQKFHYLTRGRECFIFESDDKKYILKFFDSTRYYTKIYMPFVPLPKFLDNRRNRHLNRRETKLNFNLSSAKIAYERLKDDAALLYVNLNKTNLFGDKLFITNKYGKEFILDLNDIFFILQKKCDLFYAKYESANDEAYKKFMLEAFLEMVHRRTIQLVIDDDIGKKRRNWGFIDNKAVTFDIGRWYHDEKLLTPQGYRKEMIKATKIFRKYILENEPEKLVFINDRLQHYFNEFDRACSESKKPSH